MRRLSVLLSLAAVLLVGLALGARLGPGAAGQEEEEEEEEFEVPEGVTFEVLGYGVAEELPAAPADLFLFRTVLEPGAAFPFGEDEPGVALAHVEEGVLTVAIEGPMTVLRAAGAGTPFPTEAETFAAGEEFEMGAGDSAVFPPFVAGEIRNDGEEPAVVLVAEVAPPEGGEAATPAAAGTPAA